MVALIVFSSLYWFCHWFVRTKAMVQWEEHPVQTVVSGLGVLAACVFLFLLARRTYELVTECETTAGRYAYALFFVVVLPVALVASCAGNLPVMMTVVPSAILTITGVMVLAAAIGLVVSLQAERSRPQYAHGLLSEETVRQMQIATGQTVIPGITCHAPGATAQSATVSSSPTSPSVLCSARDQHASWTAEDILAAQEWSAAERKNIFDA